jgi:LacI family transcriptional regulator
VENPLEAIRRNAAESMQTQVENYILAKIESAEWETGGKIPSERDLSESLQVSRTTVRNAIQALTDRGWFDRKIGQGTFVRRSSEGAARPPSKHGTLGYVVCKEGGARKPIAAESFYFDVFAGIEEEAARSGRHLLFSWLDDRRGEELTAFRTFLDKVDGLVVEEARDSGFLDLLAGSGVPAVLLAPTLAHERLDIVTMDLAAGVRRAIGCLRSSGHRRIGIVNGPLRLETARLRFAAWREAMDASGVSPEEGWSDSAEDWSAEAGFAATDRLLDRAPDLDAIFCANDLIAVGALSALAGRGLRVPADISVMGFDDTELARHTVPPLTTMRIYAHDMARSAARRLLERIESPGLPPVRIEFPIELIERGSCREVQGGEEER